MNPYAMAALQAAQWSSNNSYPAAGQSTTQALKSASAAYLPARLKSSKSWPSNFDTEGAAYHFQPKSGCFLDPVTQYYYCPRSKTYYNAVTGDYLKYNGGDDPDELYRKFIVPEPTTTDEVGHAAEAAAAAAATALPTGARKPVILNIGFGGAKSKTKTATPIMPAVIESKSASDAVPAVLLTSANSSAFAKMTENVMKWEERRREENEAEASKTAVVSISVPSAGATQPVCLLCRRQFPSFDVLRRHEKESKLHAENVAKAAAASQASAYRDRASERRILYPNEKEESSEKIQETINKSVEHPAVVVATAAPPRPVDQDEANPGNALLRRMGWTDGTGLGKEGSGEVIPVALNERVSGASLAPGEKTGVGLEDRLPGLSYGDVAEYKQSVYKATKARFDMVSKGNNAS